ncbi:hypothetical protein INT43_006342 [Umbelopsis isabellina]|uniref:SCP domain-containing protein n=1 Tax=Mortierella isabellina TaxID=91625 RepID=A0A8H7UIU5_MORIS|nr:hypothetical protein INT43_006342 [Umbelopsis isabellina]
MVSLSYFSIGLAVAAFAAQAVNGAPATEEVSHSEHSKHHVSNHRFHHAHREHHGKKSTKAPVKKSTKKPTNKKTQKAKSTVKLTKKSTKSIKKSSSKKHVSKSLTKKAPTGSSGTGASGVSSSDVQTILSAHNADRKDHSAPALTWNATLASYAQNWSNGCVFKHSGGPYGENLGEGYGSWKDVVDAWYSEGDLYDYSNPGFSESTGHFTQVVWIGTRSIGCGVTKCSSLSGAPLYTCSYYPPGNYLGEFKQNVLEH